MYHVIQLAIIIGSIVYGSILTLMFNAIRRMVRPKQMVVTKRGKLKKENYVSTLMADQEAIHSFH